MPCWIEKSRRDQAQAQGYTVVDASSVIATHLSHLLQSHAHELLGHEEVQQLLNRLGKTAPKLVEDLVPKILPMSVVVKVLQYLLLERVPIRNLRTMCETLAELAPKTQDPLALVAAVRVALGRSIVQNIGGLREELPVITLDPALEQVLQDSMAGGGNDGTPGFEPGLADRIQQIARRQHAPARGRRRARGAAGRTEDSALDRAPDALLEPDAVGACVQRDSGKPSDPRDRGGRSLMNSDSWRLK